MDDVCQFWASAHACAALVDLPRLAQRVGGWGPFQLLDGPALRREGLPERIVARWANARPWNTAGRVITLADPLYPALLRAVPRPPALLCVEGSLDVLQRPAVAVVGARRCTADGAAVARQLGHALSSAGWCVVSGLARGIDTAAHLGASTSGRTVAVLAHGLAHTAPASNRRLRRQIVADGGAVVTTLPDHVEPRPYLFPIRNRWIAGLVSTVVIVEAARRSGTMHTVRAATDFGREVYAVPGAISAPASRGCLQLIDEGAGVVVSVQSFLEGLGSVAPSSGEWVDDVIGGTPLVEVALKCGRSVHELVVELGRLELTGVVVRLPGRRYSWGAEWESSDARTLGSNR
ncbi:MAG: DNA processing protein [Myxococcota bacterium]|jgi:DNA processing protein